MKTNNLILNNYIPKEVLDKKIEKNFSKKVVQVLEKIKIEIKDTNKTLNVLNKTYNFSFKFKNLDKFKKFKTITLIGMGGSILGSEAICAFLESKIKKKINFINDLDPEKIKNLKKNKNFNKTLFLVISKSGNTIETLSNFFSLNILKSNAKNIVVISERKNNYLFNITKKLNLYYIEHKPNIGGRYSVLSEVGMIPAYLMGLNIYKIREKINQFLTGASQTYLKDSSTKLACLLHSKKFNNLIFLNYSPKAEKFLFWCQQLIAESLGKKQRGFLPIISNVPKDHHSLLQLYLDGPKNKIFHIFSTEKNFKIKLNTKKFGNNNYLNNKNLDTIKDAQQKALIKTFKEKKIPFREFKIKKINEETIGELFSYFILETIIIGELNNINPYDQPAVELVKIYTKKILS